ncbi:hypothetical protein B0H13DRAFT_2541459 [Mycena leptocephala]|nr:hypothetical protein B0H13DRAFT_2541459 [Mycena leptocephala]
MHALDPTRSERYVHPLPLYALQGSHDQDLCGQCSWSAQSLSTLALRYTARHHLVLAPRPRHLDIQAVDAGDNPRADASSVPAPVADESAGDRPRHTTAVMPFLPNPSRQYLPVTGAGPRVVLRHKSIGLAFIFATSLAAWSFPTASNTSIAHIGIARHVSSQAHPRVTMLRPDLTSIARHSHDLDTRSLYQRTVIRIFLPPQTRSPPHPREGTVSNHDDILPAVSPPVPPDLAPVCVRLRARGMKGRCDGYAPNALRILAAANPASLDASRPRKPVITEDTVPPLYALLLRGCVPPPSVCTLLGPEAQRTLRLVVAEDDEHLGSSPRCAPFRSRRRDTDTYPAHTVPNPHLCALPFVPEVRMHGRRRVAMDADAHHLSSRPAGIEVAIDEAHKIGIHL